MEFLQLLLRRHFAGKSVMASQDTGCFLKPLLRSTSKEHCNGVQDIREIVLNLRRLYGRNCTSLSRFAFTRVHLHYQQEGPAFRRLQLDATERNGARLLLVLIALHRSVLNLETCQLHLVCLSCYSRSVNK